MKINSYFLVADYIDAGISKHEWFEIAAPSENIAVNAILNSLENQGKDVQCIINVLGIESMEELTHFVLGGPIPGTACVAHIFHQEGEFNGT